MLTAVASSDCIRYALAPEVMAFTTTRSIARDTTAISSLTGIPEHHIVIPHQVHGDGVATVDDTFLALAPERQRALLDGIDAVITPCTNVCIGVSTADCVPILLYDGRQRVAAAVHAGWRGTRLRIVKKVITTMTDQFQCAPQTMVAVIGPCICRHCFEVGQEVYDAFGEAQFDMSAIATRYPAGQRGLAGNAYMRGRGLDAGSDVADERELDVADMRHLGAWAVPGGEDKRDLGLGVGSDVVDMRDTKWHIDLRACNAQQLTACGISNIAIAPYCTYETPSILFSARREQHGATKCGRNYSAIIIRDTLQ